MAFWVTYWLLAAKVVPLDPGFFTQYLRIQLDRTTYRWLRNRE